MGRYHVAFNYFVKKPAVYLVAVLFALAVSVARGADDPPELNGTESSYLYNKSDGRRYCWVQDGTKPYGAAPSDGFHLYIDGNGGPWYIINIPWPEGGGFDNMLVNVGAGVYQVFGSNNAGSFAPAAASSVMITRFGAVTPDAAQDNNCTPGNQYVAPPDPDFDGDGTPDSTDTDDDNDGEPDTTDPEPKNAAVFNPDTDGDGIRDNLDLDDDNDDIPDSCDNRPLEPGGIRDCDHDGNPDPLPRDLDGDGIPNERDTDADGDGFGKNHPKETNDLVADRDADGIPDETDPSPDAADGDLDGDGKLDVNDDDDDGDGIPDKCDSFPRNATDIRYVHQDCNKNGRDDATEPPGTVNPGGSGGSASTGGVVDTDRDGIPDDEDTDDDNDGHPDETDPDDDGDGVDDADEPTKQDCDGDRIFDDNDPDDDNDGYNDDVDPYPCDATRGPPDCDKDGIPDEDDPDDDNDGCPDIHDTDDCNPYVKCDCDGDGIIDYYDTDDDNDGCLDGEDPEDCNPAVKCESPTGDGCEGTTAFEERLELLMMAVSKCGVDLTAWHDGRERIESTEIRIPIPGQGTKTVKMYSTFIGDGFGSRSFEYIRELFLALIRAAIVWKLIMGCIRCLQTL